MEREGKTAKAVFLLSKRWAPFVVAFEKRSQIKLMMIMITLIATRPKPNKRFIVLEDSLLANRAVSNAPIKVKRMSSMVMSSAFRNKRNKM